MSIKHLLMPALTQRLLSRERLQEQRAKTERQRLARGERHRLLYFHQVDDPYSALVAQVLPRLLEHYDVDLEPHLVGPPPDSAAPERQRLVDYSRRDAFRLASHWRLSFPDPQTQPSPGAVEQATRLLAAAIEGRRFTEAAWPVSAWLWQDRARLFDAAPLASQATASAQLAASNVLRQRLGHYLGAMFFYGGEWYWGVDRLHHLERRLQALGAQRAGVTGPMFAPDEDLRTPLALPRPPPIDFYFSLRSPYSAIVTPRVFELGRLTGAPVRLRFVLPMVMRGLPVPRAKRRYIGQDAAREALLRDIPFGRLNDPVGRPTERGLALIPFAERAGHAHDYVLSFMRGVWAEGIHAGSDTGLRRIVERAGLRWAEARRALDDETWRATAQHNRDELFALGLWGVPSFRVGDTAVWGQDRLWSVQQALADACGRPPPAGG
jgi:2-hydroxychromene-2-carboxylate isomerase